MIWLEEKYINFLGPQLKFFKRVRERVYNFRCPLCGDSDQNESKTRGYIYHKPKLGDHFNYRCHNCGAGFHFKNFLRLISPTLYDEYILEKIRDRQEYIPSKTIVEEPKTREKIDIFSVLESTTGDNPGREYLLNRKILPDQLNRFYYTENFSEVVKLIDPVMAENSPQDDRIIIPFFNKDGEMTHLQGRAMGKSKMRYLTITIEEDAPKVFGLERINWNKNNIFVVEGPFDATFVPNCIAMGGSDMSIDIDRNLIYIFDNEPRNREIVKRIKKIIELGKSICLFSDIFKGKDINNMIENGHSRIEILRYINNNTLSGLKAMTKFTEWKKV